MDNRSVSTVVSYVLVLGIVAILISGLFVSLTPLVSNQQHDAVHTSLDVIAQDVAGDVETADRLALAAGENGTVELQTRLPDRVGGNQYEIAVEEDEITVLTEDSEVIATATVRTETGIQETSLDGGDLVIRLEDDQLVIRNA